jgi:hypothetical protein
MTHCWSARPVGAAIACLLWSATAARAQSPIDVSSLDAGVSPVEVSAGVMMAGMGRDLNQHPKCDALSMPCSGGANLPDGGLTLSLGVHATDQIILVGEIGALASSLDEYQTSGCPPAGRQPPAQCAVSRTNRIGTALAGVRIRSATIHTKSAPGRLRVFGQLLVGSQWSDLTPRRQAIQPGGGVDVYLQRGLTLRVQIDDCATRGADPNLSGPRFLLGLVWPNGER